MKNTTISVAAVLAVATVLAGGLTVIPNSVQEAQANPCSVQTEAVQVSSDNSGAGAGNEALTTSPIQVGDQDCEFTGPVDLDEENNIEIEDED